MKAIKIVKEKFRCCIAAVVRLTRDHLQKWPEFTDDELKVYWRAYCPHCGWKGLSRDCAGGMAIADTGDYGDVICPKCYKAVDGVD